MRQQLGVDGERMLRRRGQRDSLGNRRADTRRLDRRRRSLGAGGGNVAAPRRGNPLQMRLLFLQALGRRYVRAAVDTHVGHVLEPAPDLGMGSHGVELKTILLEPTDQRNVEGAAQGAVETFPLPWVRAR